MSTLTILQKGLVRRSRQLTNNGAALADLNCGLYINNRTPNPDDTELNYTECSLIGYSRFDLIGASWSGPTYSSPVVNTTYPNFTFTFTSGGQTIYGVILYDGAGNALAAGLLDTPFVVPVAGGSVTITNLTIQDKNC